VGGNGGSKEKGMEITLSSCVLLTTKRRIAKKVSGGGHID
jgi:hypothetical protein